MKIKSVEPIYTGGGIYIFLGQIDDNYFIADSCNYDVRIVDANPSDYTDDERFGFEEWASCEWQEEHLVRDLTDTDERRKFFLKMLACVIDNKPDGNYLMLDMETLVMDVKLKQDI